MIIISYNKQTWNEYDDNQTADKNLANGGIISADRLNHMETGISNNDINKVTDNHDNTITANKLIYDLSKTGLTPLDVYGSGSFNDLPLGTVFTSTSMTDGPDKAHSFTTTTFYSPQYNGRKVQIAFADSENLVFFRILIGANVWNSWTKLADDSKVVHSADMRKPASDVAGIDEVSTLQTQVDNSAVGTNLYTDTKDFDNQSSWINYGFWTKTMDTYNGLAVMQTTQGWNGIGQYIQVKKGDILTYSVYAKYISGTGTSNFYFPINSPTEGSYNTAAVDSGCIPVTITDSWQRVSATTVATSDGYLCPRLERTDNNANTLQIAGIKLEKGSVATDWCPNPSEILTYQALNDFYMPTVKAYGAKGDGVTDDTVAIQKAIDANVNGAIAFPPGTYLINDTIKINQRCSLHFYGATVKATKAMSVMFYTDNQNFENDLQIISMIGDGASCLDLNNNASIGIRASGLILQTFSIKNLPDNAIGIKVEGISKIANIMMANSISTTGTVGIQFDITDCRLQHFVPVNIEKGIVVNQASTHITDYHPWSVIMPMTNRTVGIQVNTSGVYLNDYYADTCFKGIEVSGPNTLIIINNFGAFWNTEFYNDKNSSPVPYLFYFDNFDKSYKGEHILVSNSILLNGANVKGQYGFWSNLTDNNGFGLSNVQISKQTENINGIATQFLA